MIATQLACTAMLLLSAPDTFVLESRLNVWDVAAEDLTGDGMAEVIVLSCDENSYPLEKELRIFSPDAKGAYPREATQVLPLDAVTGTLFFAETDGEAPKELVTVHAGGAAVYRYGDAGFALESATEFTSLLPSGSKEPLFLRKTANDLDGDGVDEWLIPAASGYEVRNAAGRIATVPCNVVSEVRRNDSTLIYHRLPAFHLFERGEETQKGLAFLSDEFADFAYGEKWGESHRFRIPDALEEKWEASARMGDIDGDGFPDLMVTQTKGTVNLEARTQVYIASAPFTYPEKPTATFVSKGAIASPVLHDVDGDERLDVILLSIPFGLANFMNLFLRGKVSVDVEVWIFEGPGFGKKPAYDTRITMDAPEGREQVAYTLADFNGDGRLDVAYGRADDTMVVRVGEPNRFVSRRPWVELELPSFGIARAHDLNGNAGKDIILYHPGGAEARRVDVIVF